MDADLFKISHFSDYFKEISLTLSGGYVVGVGAGSVVLG